MCYIVEWLALVAQSVPGNCKMSGYASGKSSTAYILYSNLNPDVV